MGCRRRVRLRARAHLTVVSAAVDMVKATSNEVERAVKEWMPPAGPRSRGYYSDTLASPSVRRPRTMPLLRVTAKAVGCGLSAGGPDSAEGVSATDGGWGNGSPTVDHAR